MQTEHYQIRARQRGISEPLIELIYTYGRRFSRPGGAEAYVLGGKGVDRATKDIKRILQAVPKLKDVVLVTNGEPITVYHQTKENLRLR
jgi:hypothetical protein